VRTYEPCQLLPKNKAKGEVPMLLLPTIDEPFKTIAMDIVGPLIPSRNGHRFLFVITDYCTRYPDAIPLQTTNAKKIAEVLELYFCRVGVPKEILTDQGSNFVSKILQEVNKLHGIKPIRTSPFHPQTDGLCENLFGTSPLAKEVRV
jgi:transposase InsO family protein